MQEVSLQQIKARFASAGEPTAVGYDLGELRWRMYQWRKIGLMYFSERLDRLEKEGRIAACFVIDPPKRRVEEGRFVPEPFPVLARVYDALVDRHQWDRVGLLTVLARLKLAHELQRMPEGFASPDEEGLYCALIDRCYDLERPFRGEKVYWILFDEDGVEFLSAAFHVDAGRLEKFIARPDTPVRTIIAPPLSYN